MGETRYEIRLEYNNGKKGVFECCAKFEISDNFLIIQEANQAKTYYLKLANIYDFSIREYIDR